MRHQIFGVIIFLAACTPSEMPKLESQNTAVLSAVPQVGEWVFYGTMDYNSVCYGSFGAPESECLVSIRCGIDIGNISIILPREKGERRETRLHVLTDRASVALVAFTDGELGTHADTADPAEIAALRQALMPTQERFAIQIADVVTVFPWNDEIYELLLACQ